MRYRYLHIAFIALAAALVGCQEDRYELSGDNKAQTAADGVMTLTTTRTDGKIALAVDASEVARSGVWIDLDGDGLRAKDTSEDVSTFDAYVEYPLSDGVKTVRVYGAVTYLGCASNSITAIDASDNTALLTLNCPQNQLLSIDVSKNTLLERLDCSGNAITSLNVSTNKALLSLWCFNNKLNALNVSANANLAFLDCSGNRLSALDVSKNVKLVRLLCYNNLLPTLDISKNSNLNRLWAFGNPFAEKESDKLVSALAETVKGELWISNQAPSAEVTAAVASKGWVIK